jgi:hypothetical protein
VKQLCETDRRILSGAREPDIHNIATEAEFNTERERLKKSFLSKEYVEPSEDDVKWGLLNRKAIKHASNGDFGLSTIMYSMMAQFLVRRWRLREALELYLYVCLLDLNGANNVSGFGNDREILKQFPAFNPRLAFLAPAPLDQVARIATKLGLSKDELRRIVEKRSAGLPISVQQSWTCLEKAIWPDPSAVRKPVHDAASISRAPRHNEIEQVIELPDGRKNTIWRDARAVGG